jgi:hypothetical protein
MAGLFNDLDPIQNVATNQYGVVGNSVSKGSLISFEYPVSYAAKINKIHDKKPMLIVTDVWAPNYIRGLNLHYLTFPYMKKILETWVGNQGFSYSNIKADRYVATAFRMYSLAGVVNPKRLDSEWLKTVLQSVRSFDAGEVEKIKSSIEQQINNRLQIKAKELTSYEKTIKQNQIINNRQLNTKVAGVQNNFTSGTQRGFTAPQPQELSQNVNPATGGIQTGQPENT